MGWIGRWCAAFQAGFPGVLPLGSWGAGVAINAQQVCWFGVHGARAALVFQEKTNVYAINIS